MAEGKKGFILYADIIHTVKKLPIEKRGELFTVILEYVNDKNPEVSDLLVELVWEPIKHQLKRDLKKYESRAERSRENGAKGGRPPKNPEEPKKPSGLKDNPEEPRKPDTVNGIDTVIVNDTGTDTVIDSGKGTKKSSAASGPSLEYKNICKLWFEFVEKRNGVKPSFTAVDGKSLKSIIAYISKQQNEGQKTEDTFKFILDRWPVLNEWMQSNCLDLKIFNSKINTVLDQIKNGTGKKQKGFTERVGQYFDATNPDYKDL